MNRFIMLPVILPFISAVLMLFFPKRLPVQRWIHIASSAIQCTLALIILGGVVSGGVLSLQIGGWQAPFGITFVADLLFDYGCGCRGYRLHNIHLRGREY